MHKPEVREEQGLKCKLCHREAKDEGLCEHHLLAMKKLREGYSRWKEAYSRIEWEDYMRRVLELGEAGEWVKDVINYLLAS